MFPICISLSLSRLHQSLFLIPSLSSAHAPVGGYIDFNTLYTFTLANITHSELIRCPGFSAAHGLWNGTRLLSFTSPSSMRDGDRHDSEQPRDQSRSSSCAEAAVRATEAGSGCPAAPVCRAGGGVRALLQ